MVAIEDESAEARLLRKAINLFTFLGRTQQLLVKPVRTVDRCEKAMWFGALPDHPAVHSAHRSESPDAEAPLLAVERVPLTGPPALPEQLRPWVDGGTDDADTEPSLRDAIYAEGLEPMARGPSTRLHSAFERRRVLPRVGRRCDIAPWAEQR